MKIYIKGNFVALVDGLGDTWMDNCENVIMNITGVTSYALFMNGINKVNNFVFSDVEDENGDPYASQDIFEEYIYSNTGVRFQQPLIQLYDLNDVVISAPSNGQSLVYNGTTSKWENLTSSATGGDMTKAVYDTDNDGVVDSAEKLEFIGKNSTGVTIGKTKVVYISGATGQKPNITLADASLEISSSKTIGVTRNSISHNTDGYIITHGTLHDVNTAGFADGDALWLSETAGEFTNVIPNEPAHAVFIGYVAYANATNGKIILHIQNGYELNELHGVKITSETDKDIVYYNNSTALWENATISEILGYTPASGSSEFIFVYSKSNLPTPSGGVITLANNVTYYFTTTIDLTGDRLVGGVNTTILGGSSENCIIKSTGLSSATALITSSYSLPIRNITITHGTALNLTGDGSTTALDWFGVNFTNCATVGIISNYTNFIMNDSAFLNSQGLTFNGTIGTIGMTNCLFDCASGGTVIILPSTLTISRRFRIIYSSFVVLSGETGLNASDLATIGDEKYILDTVNFSGGGTYLTGLNATYNKSLFANCVGITNTSTRGFMYMIDNTTATGTNNTTLWFKALGTTTAMGTNSKFTMPSSNRLTYTGAFSQSFMVTVNCNVRTSVSTQNINIGIAKNGTIISESAMTILCAAGSTPSFGATQIVVELTTNDYVELFVQNSSSANNTIVSDMNFNVIKIPV
jgi:hypothetical protein